MSEPAGMSTNEDMARWEALEAEARDRLDGEARESAQEAAAAPAPPPGAWDENGPSWYQDPDAASAGSPTPEVADVAVRQAARQPDILLADADPAIGASLEQAMVNRGWSVRRVTHGEVALAEFIKAPPDCFVFDFSLPGLGGLDLLRKLDDYGIVEDVRLVANAAQAPAIHVQRAKASGVHRFLDRPRRGPDQIVEAVAEQLAEADRVSDGPQADPVPVNEPTAPAPYSGGIFSDPTSAPSPASAAVSPPARPDEGRSYRSAFGTGGGPPGRVPKLD